MNHNSLPTPFPLWEEDAHSDNDSEADDDYHVIGYIVFHSAPTALRAARQMASGAESPAS